MAKIEKLAAQIENRSESNKIIFEEIEDILENVSPEEYDAIVTKLIEDGYSVDEVDDEPVVDTSNLSGINYYFAMAGQYTLLSREEETRLAVLASEGDEEARDLLACSNLRLVISIAKKYLNRGPELDDLISEGNVGLMIAVDKFNPQKGFKFGTYATWWIRQRILKLITDTKNTVRIPVSMAQRINAIKRVTANLTNQLLREPSLEEIAEASGFTVDQIKDALKYDTSTVSLDKPVNSDSDDTLLDFISNELADNNFEDLEQLADSSNFKMLTKTLNKKEFMTICLRFGVLDNHPRTYEQIGEYFGGESKVNAKATCERAIRKMKQQAILNNLSSVA